MKYIFSLLILISCINNSFAVCPYCGQADHTIRQMDDQKSDAASFISVLQTANSTMQGQLGYVDSDYESVASFYAEEYEDYPSTIIENYLNSANYYFELAEDRYDSAVIAKSNCDILYSNGVVAENLYLYNLAYHNYRTAWETALEALAGSAGYKPGYNYTYGWGGLYSYTFYTAYNYLYLAQTVMDEELISIGEEYSSPYYLVP